jgi:hypothetical protein
MNNISEAIVKDYAFARGMFAVTGYADLATDMERMKEAVKVLWPQFEIDLDAAADALNQ